MKKTYSYSYDEERYNGTFDTPEEAAQAGFNENDDAESVFVGTNIPPPQPETFIDSDTLILRVKEQEEYNEDWSESWPRVTKDQLDKLTTSLREVFGKWLDEHDQRPAFFTVEKVKQYDRHTFMNPTQPDPTDPKPEIPFLMPEGAAVAKDLQTAIAEEGGPTRENLVLCCFGYALRQLDHFQHRQLATSGLPLTDEQSQIVLMMLTDIGVMAAKQAAITAKAGVDLEQWATINELEAHGIALANLEMMVSNSHVRLAGTAPIEEIAPAPEP